MGSLVESCRQRFYCCNNEEKRPYADSEVKSESVFETSIHDDDDNDEGSSKKLVIPTNIIDMKVKLNDLVIEHQTSPWKYYKELSVLGTGTYGTVKKVCLIKNPLTIRAMKIISKENLMEGMDNTKLIDEISILKKLDHPNIMKIYEFFIDDNNFYIISDFCDQGDLLGKLEKLGKMNEIVVKFYMDQILNAVSYLHSKNVLHGDIKLENLLLYTASKNKVRRFTAITLDINDFSDLQKEMNKSMRLSQRSKKYVDDMLNYEIKLIDFGCSKYFKINKIKKKLSGIIGSTLYCSPEVVDDLYDEKCDEWSCGVLIYILLCGRPPFQGKNEEEIFQKIKKCQFTFDRKEFDVVSDNCKDLIKKLLEPNNKKRIKASDALKHPFFTESFNPNKAMTENKDLSILKKLINCKKPTSKFHESIYAFICNNYINVDEEKKLRAVFRYIDQGEKNALSKEALKNCLKEIDIDLPDEEFNNIFDQLDANKSGFIEYQEFLRTACDRDSLLSEENLKNTFLVLSGREDKKYIDAYDIKNFIFRDAILSSSTFNEYFGQFGMKIEDKMSFRQFSNMIKNDTRLDEEINKIDKKKLRAIRKYSNKYTQNMIEEEKDEETKDAKEK